MNFKPIEITLPPPYLFDNSTEQFIGQKMNNATLCAIKSSAQSELESAMAMGKIKSIPKVYVGVDANQPHRVLIQTPKYIHDCEECEYLGQYLDADLYIHLGKHGGSLIARFGDEPSSYVSMTTLTVVAGYAQLPLEDNITSAPFECVQEARRRATIGNFFNRSIES